MALIERIKKTTDATAWEGQIPLSYRYTPGRGGQVFFTALKDDGKLLGSRCGECGVTYVPLRIFCELCFGRIEDAVIELGTAGTVETFTVCHEAYDGSRKAVPSVVAMIRLDGADGVLMHRLAGVDAGDVRIGMRVQAVLKKKGDREGSILDIEHFEPG